MITYSIKHKSIEHSAKLHHRDGEDSWVMFNIIVNKHQIPGFVRISSNGEHIEELALGKKIDPIAIHIIADLIDETCKKIKKVGLK